MRPENVRKSDMCICHGFQWLLCRWSHGACEFYRRINGVAACYIGLIRFSARDGLRKFLIWRAGRYITLEICGDCAPSYQSMCSAVIRYAG